MEETTWAALTVVLTILGLAWTVIAFRRRGAINALRALGFTLLPAAAWLTGTLTMFTEIVSSISNWATNLVFDPQVWTGVALAGVGVGFVLLAAFLRDRQLAKVQDKTATAVGKSGSPSSTGTGSASAVSTPRPASTPSTTSSSTTSTTGKTRKSDSEPEMEDVEEMLRKRGIE